ncbi:PAS domain S-box protein, partial [Geomonas sp.]|uniref:PAS domain S-box protein n=1 Tax=Geomonas sp. TaxID=2651584 RepID=UPI002B4A833F
MFSLSLKTKITVLVSLLVAGLLSLLTLVTLADVEKQLKVAIAEQQATLASAMAKQLDYKISLYRNELVDVARSIPAGALRDPALAGRFLADRIDTASMFESGLFLVAPGGRLLASTVDAPQEFRKDCPFAEETARSIRERSPRISDPYLCGNRQSDPMVLFTAPVLGKKGEVLAVLAGRLNLMKENFLGEVADGKIGKQGYFYILNQQRVLVVHHARERILTRIPPGVNAGIERALQGAQETAENRNSAGVRLLSSFRQLHSTGWLLSANYPLQEAYLPIERIRTRMLSALVIMVAAAVCLVGLAMRTLLAPLLSFTRQVTTLSGVDTVAESVRIDSRDEIEELAVAFNALMGKIASNKSALQAEKEFELSLLQHSSLPTFVLGADHRILHWNRACERITGVTAAELVGTAGHGRAFFGHDRPTLADLVIDGGTKIASFYPCCRETGEGFHAEGWYRHLNGMDRYLSFYAAPIHTAAGELAAVIETIEDITDRKKSEEAARHTVSLLNATLESTADGILVRGLDGRITTYNRKFAEMWNLPQELLDIGDDMQMRLYAKEQVRDPEKFFAITQLLYEQPELDSRDVVELKDGRVFERVSKPQRIDNIVVGRVISFRDITEREQAKAALCDSINRYRSLVDNIDLGITLIDADHRIVMTNAAAARMFNRHPADIVHSHCFREFEKRGAICRHCPGTQAMRSGQPASVQTEGVREDGSRFSVRIRAFPVLGADGTATGFIEVIQDITEQLQAEADKKLLEAQLRQSQKMEALGTLAGGIAHDFNNILTAIFAYTSLIDRKLERESPARNYLNKLIASSERASTLTQRLLTYSRKQPLAPQPVDLNEVVDKVAHLLSRLLGEDIELAIQPASQPLTVMADASQLGQVLMNLATNARDAMPEGGRLTIAASRQQADDELARKHGFEGAGSYAALTVSDNGLGMEEALLDRIFEP